MAGLLKSSPAGDVANLRVLLDDAIAGITSQAMQVPIEPDNTGTFIEMGSAIAALETLKNHLPQ